MPSSAARAAPQRQITPATGSVPSGLLAAGFALLLLAAAAWELGADQLRRRAVPARSSWRQAERFVRKHRRPGDLIVTAPKWADPLGRMVLGDLLTLDDVTRPDSRTYGRIWELSLRGASHPDTRGLEVSRRETFGGVRVTLYTQRPVHVAADLYASLPRARVWQERGRKITRCHWSPRLAGHQCGPRWKEVRQIRAEIGYEPRRCVLAMPMEGATRVIEYPPLPRGHRLVVWTGLRGYDPRYRARRAVWEYRQLRAGRWRQARRPPPVTSVPVTMDVLVNGARLARLSHPIEDEGWRRHVLAMPRPPRSTTAVIQLRIRTRHAWAKHFCFYARSEVDP